MAKTSEGKEIQFTFDGDYYEEIVRPPHLVGRKSTCDFCETRYKSPHIEIDIGGFTICPACILSGPIAVATEAKRIAGDKERLARMWEYNLNKIFDRQDAMSMAKIYRSVASDLRGVGSFEEIPGGAVAVAIAGVATKARPRRRKAA